MSAKEQVICRVSDQLYHQLNRYAAKEKLNQTQVYERATRAFLAWYDEMEDLDQWRARASAQIGTPYRGRVLKTVKERLVQVGEAHNHPLTDILVTALMHLMEQEALEQVELMTCFLPQDMYERCEQEVGLHFVDRSEFAQQICENYLQAWSSSSPPPLKETDHIGQAYPAYISSSIRQDIEALARTHTVSPVDVYASALSYYFRDQESRHTALVTALVPESLMEPIETYMHDTSMSESQWMESACKAFNTWYPRSPYAGDHAQDLQRAPLGGVPMRGYISTPLKKSMEKLPHPRLDVYSMAVLYFAHIQDVSRATYLFGFDDIPDKNPTGGTVKLMLLEEQDRLIRLVMIMAKLKNMSDFCMEALEWWLVQRRQIDGSYDQYYARITPGPEDDLEQFVEYNIAMPYRLHSEAQLMAQEDKQSLRTVYYNATIRYLDHLMDSPAFSKFFKDINQIHKI